MGSLDNVFEKENLEKFIIKCNTTLNPIIEEERTEVSDSRTDNLNIGENAEIEFNNDEILKLGSNMKHKNENENENEIIVTKKRKSKKKIIQENDMSQIQNIDSKNILRGELKNIPSEFMKNIPQNVTFVVEPKIDGLSLSVRYDGNGTFLGAGTRGDGIEGEDVSSNIAVSRCIYKHVCTLREIHVHML